MASRPKRSEIFDINQNTGALILGKDRLEDYAEKYLTQHCKKALETPMPLPVDELLDEEGLTVEYVSLSRNLDIFGCCMLLDGEVNVYDHETDSYHLVSYPEGTILIDPDSEALCGEGAKRNTLIHEAIHWEKDRTYFKILSIKNAAASEKLYPIMCRQSEQFYEPPGKKNTKENEVKWLEWQAHRLAPRILMPLKSFKQKAQEIIELQGNSPSCDALIEALSDFFIVSRDSVKYRLIEAGLQDCISSFDDYDAVFAEINNKTEFVPLSPIEAFQLLDQDSSFYKWVKNGHFLFVDGYFVLANKEYITSSNGDLHLTDKAKKNLSSCVINIHEHKYKSYQNIDEDLRGFTTLYKIEGVDERILMFHPKYQANCQCEPKEAYEAFYEHLQGYDEVEEKELMRLIGDPDTSLCKCLWFLMENRHWSYPSQFSSCTELHENYFGRIKNDKYNNMGTNVLMAICVGLRLNLRLTEKLFDKSRNKLDYSNDPDKTYIRIMENMPGLSIDDFNAILEEAKIPPLGTKDAE